MDVERKYAEIIRTIVTLAHTLGMDLVAEGVETANQLAQLRTLKVDFGQGYYFGKPLDSEQTEFLIGSWPQW
jgi:EAL domain-containing protein (putative c-di-GMP-specific phosphodiesterase class I)